MSIGAIDIVTVFTPCCVYLAPRASIDLSNRVSLKMKSSRAAHKTSMTIESTRTLCLRFESFPPSTHNGNPFAEIQTCLRNRLRSRIVTNATHFHAVDSESRGIDELRRYRRDTVCVCVSLYELVRVVATIPIIEATVSRSSGNHDRRAIGTREVIIGGLISRRPLFPWARATSR